MSTTLILRDETAASDLYTEAYWPDPVVSCPTAGWEADYNNSNICMRIVQLFKQAEMYTLPGGTGHTYSVKRNGVVVRSISPWLAYTQKTLTLHANGGATIETVVCTTEALWDITLRRYKLHVEMFPGAYYIVT